MELYVHIPFCVRKCVYCDFYSVACGASARDVSRYTDAVLTELDARMGNIRGKEITSIFVGGGTPSLLSCADMEKLFGGIYDRTGSMLKAPEITVECNPGTLDAQKLRVMKQLGVNRLSLGLQSANDSELRTLGRIHTVKDFLNNLEAARSEGFDNINADIMTCIPGQTLKSCEETLETVANLGLEHISAYSLILEEGTPLFDDVEAGRITLPGEETDRLMYELTGKVLAGYGYHRYEISNYAKPQKRCRHNMGYWTGREYLGLGVSAASYLAETNSDGYAPDTQNPVMIRSKNLSDIEAYLADPAGIGVVEERLGREDLMSEFMILGLRLTDGADKAEFKRRFDEDAREVFKETIDKYEKMGLLKTTDKSIALTSRGFDVANTVMCDFLPD